MTIMEWNDRLNLGVELLDNAHRKLFSIMRRMLKLHENPENHKLMCQEGIKYLKNYTLKHFEEEESYMRSINYAGYEKHKRLHDNLRDRTLPTLEHETEQAGYSAESVQRFMGVIMAWLTQHIMMEDRAITGKVPTRYIHVRPKDEIHALEESISQIIQAMLGFKSQLVSECYHGENIGEIYFCRLYYTSANGAQIIVYIGFEENLVLAAASEMMGTRVKKVSKLTQSVVKQLSKSIVKNLGKYFAYLDSSSLKKDSMISYELLIKTFQNEYPPVSILFRTDEGYLVFCVQTSELQEQ